MSEGQAGSSVHLLPQVTGLARREATRGRAASARWPLSSPRLVTACVTSAARTTQHGWAPGNKKLPLSQFWSQRGELTVSGPHSFGHKGTYPACCSLVAAGCPGCFSAASCPPPPPSPHRVLPPVRSYFPILPWSSAQTSLPNKVTFTGTGGSDLNVSFGGTRVSSPHCPC